MAALSAIVWYAPKLYVTKTTSDAARDHHMRDVRFEHGELNETEANEYIGDAACKPCHSEIVKRCAGTRHATTMRPVTLFDDGDQYRSVTKVSDKDNGVDYSTSVHHGDCIQNGRIRTGESLIKAVWEIGSGKNARSYLSEQMPEGTISLRLSWYVKPKKFDFTSGQAPGHSLTTVGGAALTREALTNCVQCHATTVRSGVSGPNLANSHVAIGCERCHGPAKLHVAACSAGKPAAGQLGIELLKAASSDRVNAICMDCHTSSKSNLPGLPNTERNLSRFSGAALMRSECFQRSTTMSCTTCHDPHLNTEQQAQRSDAACLTCHHEGSSNKICKVNSKSACSGCHMPRQPADDMPYTLYTNHWIKVWKR